MLVSADVQSSVKAPQTKPPVPRALVALAVCGIVLLTAVATGRLMDSRRARAVDEEQENRSRSAGLRAKDALQSTLASMELVAQNAASNPRLVAAMEGGVDDETLRDIFRNEHWWARYRDKFDSFNMSNGDKLAAIEGTPLPTADALSLVRGARKTQGAASALVSSNSGRPFVAAASVVPLATRASPVLVVGSRMNQRLMDGIAARAGGAVAISDGRKPLLIAGDDAGLVRVAEAAGREGKGAPEIVRVTGNIAASGGTGSVAVAVDAVAPGLWLLTHAGTGDLAQRMARADQRHKNILWAIDVPLAVGLLAFTFWFRRGTRPIASRSRNRDDSPGSVTAAAGGDAGAVASADPTAAEEPLPVTAERLGQYVLLEQIGEGGMAQIFTAIRIAAEGFRRLVVIKRLRPELANNGEAVSQFIDEANLTSQLVHSNIVPVFDFGKVNGQYYIAQEYIVGRDLGRVLSRLQKTGTQGLPLRAVLFAAREVLNALDYAHNKHSAEGKPAGIVHRDVTPENIMVSARGEVKLLDFGIVKAAEGRVTKTQVGMVKGSVGFMSPEQARGREVDNRSDLFAVGLLMYTCFTGRTLYQGATMYDLMVKAATGPGAAELERIGELPAPLPELLLHALAVNPTERFQSAAEFTAALSPHVGGGSEELGSILHQHFDLDLQYEERHTAATAAPIVVADVEPSPAPSPGLDAEQAMK